METNMDSYLQLLFFILGIFIANAALMIPLFIWHKKIVTKELGSIRQIIVEIHEEIKDFHKRLGDLENKIK